MFLSLRYKMPIVLAWSTPGIALLAEGLVGIPFADAVGAFMLAAAFSVICGLLGWADKLMRQISPNLAAAMLAGVLFRFGTQVFASLSQQLWLVLTLLILYIVCRRLIPRYTMVIVLLVGVLLTMLQGKVSMDLSHLQITHFVWTTPSLSWQSVMGLAIPLFVVAMASQNLPGVAVLHASGYHPPSSALVTTTGLVSLLSAPFGAHGTTLAAIVAAICTGSDAHPDAQKRYAAAVIYAVFYLILGLIGTSVALFFQTLPLALVASLAGLALFGTIQNSLATAMRDDTQRDAALVTLLCTASGMSLFGVGSAFWGLVFGVLTQLILNYRRHNGVVK